MKRLLLIEDDAAIQKTLTFSLKASGYALGVASSLGEARDLWDEGRFDLILLDLSLPDGDGLDFLVEFREREPQVPVLVLTARTEEEDAVRGLSAGANDYIRKPFGLRELTARIRQFLGEGKTLAHGNVVVDPASHGVRVSERAIEIPRREFDLLCFLFRNAGQVVSREQCLRELAQEADVFDRAIDKTVSRLRSRLEAAGAKGFEITSVYGVGYRLDVR